MSKNAQTYQEELSALDEEIREVVATSERKTAFFGSRFALHYFFKEYGLEHVSAYDNCSTEGEPSVAVMSDMIAQMQEQSIPVVYYAELEDPKIARTIQEETGAEMLLFHSCHNIGAEEMEQGGHLSRSYETKCRKSEKRVELRRSMNIITCQDVTICYQGREAVSHVSFFLGSRGLFMPGRGKRIREKHSHERDSGSGKTAIRFGGIPRYETDRNWISAAADGRAAGFSRYGRGGCPFRLSQRAGDASILFQKGKAAGTGCHPAVRD